MTNRFATQWGGKSKEHLASNNKEQSRQPQRVILEFLQPVGPITEHHEPPKFEAKPRELILLDSAGHAFFHLRRYNLFGQRGDHDGYVGQAQQMDEQQAEKLEEYEGSAQIAGKVDAYILSLRRRVR